MTGAPGRAVAGLENQLTFNDLDSARPLGAGGRPLSTSDSPRVVLEPLLTAQEIIGHCGIGYHTLLREFRSGRLPALKLAGHWRVELSAYREWLERRRYVPRTELDVTLGPSPALASRSTSPVGSLVRLRAIEEQESK